MKQVRLVLCAVILLLPVVASSQSFTASADRNTVAVGEQFQVNFVLTDGSGKNFSPPDFAGFQITAGPMQSSNMSWVNGAYSQSITLTYYLLAKSEGNFKIGSASMNINGKNYTTNPFNITVTKSQQRAQGNQQTDDGTGITSKNVFLRASANKTRVYRGESLTITYRLYTNISLLNLNLEKMPAFAGLWTSDIEVPQPYQFKNEVYEGVNYRVATIKKVVVFPQQSGKITIDAMKGEVTARIQTKRKRNTNQWDPFSVFDDPFFGGGQVQDVPVNIKSESIVLNVSELPANAPASFTGSVGKFNMDAYIDKPQTKANESVTLKLKISGSGNLKLIDAPTLNMPPDIETYDPKTAENINVTEGGASGNKTFEYLLIPRHEGNYTIEPIEFSYFDLNSKSYISIKSKPFTLKVAKGDGSSAAAVIDASDLANKSDVAVIGKDIRFIKTNPVVFSKGEGSFFGSIGFFALLFLPFVLIGGAVFYRNRLLQMQGNVALMKSKGATKMARRRLAEAAKYLKENKNELFYDEAGKALWGYLSDKLVIPLSDLSKDAAVSKLRERNISEELILKLTSTLDMCEFARFAPTAASAPQVIYDDSLDVILKLESQLS